MEECVLSSSLYWCNPLAATGGKIKSGGKVHYGSYDPNGKPTISELGPRLFVYNRFSFIPNLHLDRYRLRHGRA